MSLLLLFGGAEVGGAPTPTITGTGTVEGPKDTATVEGSYDVATVEGPKDTAKVEGSN